MAMHLMVHHGLHTHSHRHRHHHHHHNHHHQSSSPPKPPQFEYTPSTPHTRPIDPKTFFYSQLISPTHQQPSSHDLIPKSLHISSSKHYDHQEDKELSPCLSLHNCIRRRECTLPPSCPAKKRRLAKSLTVPPPFPWATSKLATVHTLDYLLSDLKLKTVSATLVCKFCKFQQNFQFDLVENFKEVTTFIKENMNEMHDRAPGEWMNPVIPNCESC